MIGEKKAREYKGYLIVPGNNGSWRVVAQGLDGEGDYLFEEEFDTIKECREFIDDLVA